MKYYQISFHSLTRIRFTNPNHKANFLGKNMLDFNVCKLFPKVSSFLFDSVFIKKEITIFMLEFK